MNSLDKQFNLAEANPDPGGGILYCMRYDAEHIEAHHAQVVEALQRIGITFKHAGEHAVAAEMAQPLSAEQEKQAMLLLEEISVLNEAREYKEAGLEGIKNVSELSGYLTQTFYALLKSKNLADAYNFVTVFIPRMVQEVRMADEQNKVLSSGDRRALETLWIFAQSKEKFLNKPRSILLS